MTRFHIHNIEHCFKKKQSTLRYKENTDETSRLCIIYIPSIAPKITLYDVARKLVAVWQEEPAVRGQEYEAKKGDYFHYGDDQEFCSSRYTIYAKNEPDAMPVVVADLYWLDYHEKLMSDWKDLHPILQMAKLIKAILLLFFHTFGLVAGSLFTGNFCRFLGLLQLLIACLFLPVLTAYCIFLLLGVLKAIADAVDCSVSGNERSSRWLLWIPLWLTALDAILFKPEWLRHKVEWLAVAVLALFDAIYCDVLSKKSSQLDSLMKHCQGKSVDNVHIVGYSFGSLLAVNTMFPKIGNHPGHHSCIKSLTTIGFPFEMIRSYYRGFASAERLGKGGLNFRWTNIFIPLDVLSSEIDSIGIRGLRGENLPDANEPFRGRACNWWSIPCFFLTGLLAHNSYWNSREADGSDVSTQIVNAIIKAQEGTASEAATA